MAAPIAAGKPAAGDRAVHLVPEAVLAADGKHGVGVVPLEERERVLHPLVARQPFELGDLDGFSELLGRVVGRADRAHGACPHELVERRERLLDRCVRIGRVGHVQRYALDAQPLEARLDLPSDPLP